MLDVVYSIRRLIAVALAGPGSLLAGGHSLDVLSLAGPGSLLATFLGTHGASLAGRCF
jgi:hypothetical protein